MNSCPPKPSAMPYVIVILLLISMIVGMIVYHFMFYKPSQETCSNLYTSNICTAAVCTKAFPCEPTDTTWEPVVTKDSTSSPKFFGYNVTIPETGAVGTAYKSGIDSLMSEYNSNVCDTLTTMKFEDTYHPSVATVDGSTSVDKSNILCIPMLTKLDTELKKSGLTWLEKSKLLEVRRAVIDQCSSPNESGVRGGITATSYFPTTALSSKTGVISKIFCPSSST